MIIYLTTVLYFETRHAGWGGSQTFGAHCNTCILQIIMSAYRKKTQNVNMTQTQKDTSGRGRVIMFTGWGNIERDMLENSKKESANASDRRFGYRCPFLALCVKCRTEASFDKMCNGVGQWVYKKKDLCLSKRKVTDYWKNLQVAMGMKGEWSWRW